MSLPDVAYEDYAAWGGLAGAGAFEEALPHARARVREMIGFNEVEGAAREAAYTSAVCAAADVDIAYGCSGGVGETSGGFSIGSFSVSAAPGTDPAASGYDRDIARAIRAELSGTGLLYAGVGR